MDLPFETFVSNIPNTSVAACFNSSATLPSSISPSEAIHQVVLGFRKGQESFNAGQTAAPYIAVAAPIVFGTSILSDNAGAYRTVRHQITVREYIDPNNVSGNTGTTII